MATPLYNADRSIGSYSSYRPSIDISGLLNLDRSLRYRLNAAYDNAGSFRDSVSSERVFVAPVVSYQINDRTDLRVDGSYLYDRRSFDRGIVAFGTGVADIPNEVGIKAEIERRVTATLAAYQITKTNVATTDPDNNAFSLPIGAQRSRGIEFDVSGTILPGWNFSDRVEPIIYAVTFTSKSSEPVSTVIPGKSTMALAEILQRADAILPQAKIAYINFPTSPTGVFQINKQYPEDREIDRSRVYFD